MYILVKINTKFERKRRNGIKDTETAIVLCHAVPCEREQKEEAVPEGGWWVKGCFCFVF